MNAVSVKNLRVILRSSGKPILDGLCFDIGIGDRLALIGESGSGKSVTALSLLPPSMKEDGIVRMGDTDMVTAAERERNMVRGSFAAIVYQEPLSAPDPLMTVGNQIAGPLKLYRRLTGKAARAEVFRLLDMVKLSDSSRILSSYPYELSGGQRQRIAIARALAPRPRILVADEPLSALDVSARMQILDLLQELKKQLSLSIILVSHDLAIVAQLCEQTIVIRSGTVVESSQTRGIFMNPRNEYTKQFISAIPHLSCIGI